VTVATAISRERILTAARSLPAAPQAMAGLCELLQEVNADLGRIADQISVDPALASRVVRISNGVVYGGDGAIGSVEDAVNRVGFAEILRLVGAVTVSALVDRNLAGYNVAAERLRESLLLHAIASEVLARRTSIDPRTAYLAGLLRAVGMMVIARLGASSGGGDENFDARRHATYAEWEGERFGVAGTEVTAMILEEWRFSPTVVQAIRGHMGSGEALTDDPFACLLNLAGGIVSVAGMALEGEKAFWEPSAEKFAVLGITESQWREAGFEARAAYERIASALN
jgi:HD-like signal output (HDOD) protein